MSQQTEATITTTNTNQPVVFDDPEEEKALANIFWFNLIKVISSLFLFLAIIEIVIQVTVFANIFALFNMFASIWAGFYAIYFSVGLFCASSRRNIKLFRTLQFLNYCGNVFYIATYIFLPLKFMLKCTECSKSDMSLLTSSVIIAFPILILNAISFILNQASLDAYESYKRRKAEDLIQLSLQSRQN